MPEIEKHTAVLREVANFLRSLTDEQVGQLERGEARIVLGRRNTSTRKNRVSQEQSIDLADVRASLQEMDNRDEGQAFLDGLRLSKLELQELAGSLDMPVSKSDTVGKLKDLVTKKKLG